MSDAFAETVIVPLAVEPLAGEVSETVGGSVSLIYCAPTNLGSHVVSITRPNTLAMFSQGTYLALDALAPEFDGFGVWLQFAIQNEAWT